jgi:phosphate-selective porin OprO/OprP
MMTGKKFWMAGAALVALTASANAASDPVNGTVIAPGDSASVADSAVQLAQNNGAYIQLAQNDTGRGGTNGDLEARVKALEDQVAASQDRATSDRTRLSTLEQNYNYAAWSYDNGRPVLTSGDGRFTMGIRVRFQTDFAGFSQDSTHPSGFAGPADLSSGLVVRRAYFGIEGKVYNDFAYELRFNGGGSNGGLNSTCTAGGTATTTIAGAPGATATTVISPTCSIGGIQSGSEGDPMLNKAVVTYTGIPNLHINVGIIEPDFNFEGSLSTAALIFLEKPEIDDIAQDSFGGDAYRRGIEIGWGKTDALWSGDNITADVAFDGAKNGSAAGHGNGGDEQTQVLGRFTDRLWSDGISNIQIGTSLAYDPYTGNSAGGGAQALNFQDRPEIRVDGTRLISTGNIAAKTGHMYAVEAAGNIENFFLAAEYTDFTADRQCGSLSVTLVPRCTSSVAVADHPDFHGWYVEGTWVLTGETKPYSPYSLANDMATWSIPVPSRPFSLAGGSWGAWELVARYSDTDLNWHPTQLATTTQLAGVLGGEERVIALGVNWYLNRNVRVMMDDSIVTVKKGTAAIPNRDGQDLNIVGVRVQFAN